MGIEDKVMNLRAEIGKRLRDVEAFKGKIALLFDQTEVDKAVTAATRARSTEDALGALHSRLNALLPQLVEERYQASLPAIEEKYRLQLDDLDREAQSAGAMFHRFFEGWNGLMLTSLSKAAADALLGHLQPFVESAAADKIYLIAIDTAKTGRRKEIEAAMRRECETMKERIHAEVDALRHVEAAQERGAA